MMPVMAQIPSVRIHDRAPMLILGFDATHALCVTVEGRLEYVEHSNLILDWTFDPEAEIWISRTEDDETEPEPDSDVSDGALPEG